MEQESPIPSPSDTFPRFKARPRPEAFASRAGAKINMSARMDEAIAAEVILREADLFISISPYDKRLGR